MKVKEGIRNVEKLVNLDEKLNQSVVRFYV